MSLSQADLSALITQLGAALGSFQSSISSINTNLGGAAGQVQAEGQQAIETASTLDDSLSALDARVERAGANTRSYFDTIGEISSEASSAVAGALDQYTKLETSIIKQATNSNELLNSIQKSYGGQFRASSNEVAENVRRLTVDSLKTMGALSTEELEKLDEKQKIMIDGQQRNILELAFESGPEMSRYQAGVLESLSMAHSDSFKNMSSVQMDQILALGRTADLNASEIAGILERQKAMTGEMNEDLLQEMLAYAASTEKSVGLSSKVVMQGMVDLQKQVATFGTEGPKELAKISAGLQKLGVDAQTAGQMINKFMSFESAVSSISDLTTVFGVQMDAMEMTMLANTDRTEFLRRMRESILDAGVDVENMNQAQLNLLTQQLGMNQDEVRNFLKTGQEDFFADIEAGIEETDPEAEMENLLLQGENFLRSQEQMMALTTQSVMAYNLEVNELLATEANTTASRIQGTIQGATFDVATATDKIIKLGEIAAMRLKPGELATEGAEIMAKFQELSPEEFYEKTKEFGENFASGFKDGSGDFVDKFKEMLDTGYFNSMLFSSSPSPAFYNMLEGFTGTESSALFAQSMENLGIMGNQSIQSSIEDLSPDIIVDTESISGLNNNLEESTLTLASNAELLNIMLKDLSSISIKPEIDNDSLQTESEKISALVEKAMRDNLKTSELDVSSTTQRIIESKETLAEIIKDQYLKNNSFEKMNHDQQIQKMIELISMMKNLDESFRKIAIDNKIDLKVMLDKDVLFKQLTRHTTAEGETISTIVTSADSDE